MTAALTSTPSRAACSAGARSRIVTALAVAVALLATDDRVLAASGDLDETFGSEGVAIATFGSSSGLDLVRQADGKVIAAGTVHMASPEQVLAIARFDANGVLDASFGGDGLVTTDVGPLKDSPSQIVVQPDGKIIVVGNTETADGYPDGGILLVRYEADGSLDATFGSGGIVITSLGVASAGALQADGKILVVGAAGSTTSDLLVLRFESDGDLDATFGTGGHATFDFGARSDSASGVVVQPDGKIVVASKSFNGPLFLDGAIATLVRLDASGTPDPGFGSGGFVTLATDPINVFHALVLQPDGKIVALGGTGSGNLDYRLFRYDGSGNPDGGFVGDEIPVFPQSYNPSAIALLPDGKFAVTGTADIYFAAGRMNDDGSLDTTFGMGGSIEVAAGISGVSVATAADPGGDIYLAGSALPVGGHRGDYEITVAKLQGASAACTTDADCGSCERCGGSVCEIGARSGCTDATSGGAQLKFRQRYGKGDLLTLRWRGVVPSFDPITTDDLAVCLFHAGKRVLKAVAPAGGLCRGLPCWTGGGTTFDYDDRDETPHGVRRIQVEADQVKLRAHGEELATSPQGLPSQPSALADLGPPVLLQLHAGNGACVEATFDADRQVTAYRFKSKND